MIGQRNRATGAISGTGTIAQFEWRSPANGRVAVQVVASALSATLQVQVTTDGTNWVAIQSTNQNSGTAAVNITAAGYYVAEIVGAQAVRVQCTAFTSATAAAATMVGAVG